MQQSGKNGEKHNNIVSYPYCHSDGAQYIMFKLTEGMAMSLCHLFGSAGTKM